MITLGEMQIGGMMASGLLALTVALQIPRRVAKHTIYGRARWCMVAGLAMLSLHFLVQYLFGFRQMGVTQGVFVNLLFFMPAMATVSMGLLFVQRRGDLAPREWYIMWSFVYAALLLLIITALCDGVPFSQESLALRRAERVAAVLFLLMQVYSFFRLGQEYLRMKRAVTEYYDHNRDYLFRWMGLSVVLMSAMGLFVPYVIFSEGWPLVVFSILVISTIFYCTTSFQSYGISLDAQRVEEAQESMQKDEEEERELIGQSSPEPVESKTVLGGEIKALATSLSFQSTVSNGGFESLSRKEQERVERALQRWTDNGSFRKPNLTLTMVANEMGIQRYLLKAWLQSSEYGKLSEWLNHLRTEEAVRLMRAHPDWGYDVIADRCGFGSRQYFHKIFHEQMGVTPAKFSGE